MTGFFFCRSHISIPPFFQVLLKTSAGEIDIELWSKEAPKACRNFVQLCMEGKNSHVVDKSTAT